MICCFLMVMARMTNSSGLRLRLWMDSKEEGGSPIRNPSTASEDARIASLMSLEDILKQAEVSVMVFLSNKKQRI